MTPGFIDTHCHILPGVDDGASDSETSAGMLRQAAADGIHTIVATPHILPGFYEGRDVRQRLAELAGELAEHKHGIRLVAGAEVPISVAMDRETDLLPRLTIGDTRYLLLESAEVGMSQLREAVYRLQLAGLRPILAHPERIGSVQEDPAGLSSLLRRGDVYSQLTVASLTGLFGKRTAQTALELARLGLAHLVATDAHSERHRPPRLAPTYALLAERLGEDKAQTIMYRNPESLLADEPLADVAPSGGRTLKGRIRGMWRR